MDIIIKTLNIDLNLIVTSETFGTYDYYIIPQISGDNLAGRNYYIYNNEISIFYISIKSDADIREDYRGKTGYYLLTPLNNSNAPFSSDTFDEVRFCGRVNNNGNRFNNTETQLNIIRRDNKSLITSYNLEFGNVRLFYLMNGSIFDGFKSLDFYV